MRERKKATVPGRDYRRWWRMLAATATAGLAAAVLAAGPAGADTDFGFVVAFQGSNGHLWMMDQAGTPHDTMIGMAPRTSPSVVEACVAGSCPIEVAFQTSAGVLEMLNLRGGTPTSIINTMQPMAPGTSPSISYTAVGPNGAFEVAYQGTNSDLWTYEPGAGPQDTGQTMARSPSIDLPGQFTGPVIAYQTPSGGNMCLLTSDGAHSCPGVVMDPASSPSIAHVDATDLSDDAVDVAYVSIDDFLYVYNATTRVTQRINLNVAGRTSPSAIADGIMGTDGTGEIQVAFQASTSALWRDTPDTNFQQSWTAIGVAAGTSPSLIDALFADGTTGGPAIAFQGTDGRLWLVPAFSTSAQPTGLAMASGTSPATFRPF
jgi:hypothetical protein